MLSQVNSTVFQIHGLRFISHLEVPNGNRQTLKYRCTFASFLILFLLNPETVMYAIQPSIEHTSQWFIALLALFLVSIDLSSKNLIHMLLFLSDLGLIVGHCNSLRF